MCEINEEQKYLYIELLKVWNKRINLVSNASLDVAITRHIVDSLQLVRYLSPGASILDIGSGAGFPGMVLAMTGLFHVKLCERNHKKAAFLREVKRRLQVDCDVLNKDVFAVNWATESLMVTARAFSDLCFLLEIMCHLPAKRGVFLKGDKCQNEIRRALELFVFDLEEYPSVTNPASRVLVVGRVAKRF